MAHHWYGVKTGAASSARVRSGLSFAHSTVTGIGPTVNADILPDTHCKPQLQNVTIVLHALDPISTISKTRSHGELAEATHSYLCGRVGGGQAVGACSGTGMFRDIRCEYVPLSSSSRACAQGSLKACEWALANLYREGDVLHLFHVISPGARAAILDIHVMPATEAIHVHLAGQHVVMASEMGLQEVIEDSEEEKCMTLLQKRVEDHAREFLISKFAKHLDEKKVRGLLRCQTPHTLPPACLVQYQAEIVRFATDNDSIGSVVCKRAEQLNASAIVLAKHNKGVVKRGLETFAHMAWYVARTVSANCRYEASELGLLMTCDRALSCGFSWASHVLVAWACRVMPLSRLVPEDPDSDIEDRDEALQPDLTEAQRVVVVHWAMDEIQVERRTFFGTEDLHGDNGGVSGGSDPDLVPEDPDSDIEDRDEALQPDLTEAQRGPAKCFKVSRSLKHNKEQSKLHRTKLDESDDRQFYSMPRLVKHVDDRFLAQVTQLYRERIPSGGSVLDLCSSWVSHLPDEVPYARVVGHGMNAAELARNPRLDTFFVRNLNTEPRGWAAADNSFDAVLCCVSAVAGRCPVYSVQYLQQPEEVFSEIHRVLKPGGVCIVTFSNRMFPHKAISAWTQADSGYARCQVGLVRLYPRPGYSLPLAGSFPCSGHQHSSSGRHLLSPMRCMFSAALQSLSSHLPGCGAGLALAALVGWVGSAAGSALVRLLRLAGGGVLGPGSEAAGCEASWLLCGACGGLRGATTVHHIMPRTGWSRCWLQAGRTRRWCTCPAGGFQPAGLVALRLFSCLSQGCWPFTAELTRLVRMSLTRAPPKGTSQGHLQKLVKSYFMAVEGFGPPQALTQVALPNESAPLSARLPGPLASVAKLFERSASDPFYAVLAHKLCLSVQKVFIAALYGSLPAKPAGHAYMQNVEVLSLSVNRISTLKDFRYYHSEIQAGSGHSDLHLRRVGAWVLPGIASSSRNCTCGKMLSKTSPTSSTFRSSPASEYCQWLCDNPCADHPFYRSDWPGWPGWPGLGGLPCSAVPLFLVCLARRQLVARMVPSVDKLDNMEISASEKEAALLNPDLGRYLSPELRQRPTSPSLRAAATQQQQQQQQQAYADAQPDSPQQAPQQASQAREGRGGAGPDAARRRKNVLYAVMALVAELDEDDLVYVKREIEQRLGALGR
ncbi:hypothetical protein QJQ45_029126 [Haematococcus lacustris]|nr:hypothetical protein QJQ45_029126 [Haematococcus lacustris]